MSTVALTGPVIPANAPRPSNASERLLFRQVYETLIRVDCTGRAIGGLASSWRLGATGRGWLVTLRDDARFSDGAPVTADAVVAAWSRDDELHPAVSRLVESVRSVEEHVLAIVLRDRRTDVPLALAHTDLAVARTVPGTAWPLGTRDTRIVPDSFASAPSRNIDLVHEPAAPGASSAVGAVRVLSTPSGDARDLLDEGVDLLLTRDRAALDYAATLPQYVAVPLPWQWTHALAIPGRSRSSPSPGEDARDALAADALRGEARGAEDPFWWRLADDCDLAPSRLLVDGAPTTGRVVYERDDATARDLAERLVGLASASGVGGFALLDRLLPGRPPRAFQRASGLSGNELAAARRRGSDAAYVISLERRPLDPCRDLQALAGSMGWLDPGAIVPLVDTRARAVLRRGRSGVAMEWDGGLMLARPPTQVAR